MTQIIPTSSFVNGGRGPLLDSARIGELRRKETKTRQDVAPSKLVVHDFRICFGDVDVEKLRRC